MEQYKQRVLDVINQTIDRKELKHSVLAKHLKITESSLNNYLADRRKMPMDIGIRLILELQIDLNELFQVKNSKVFNEQEYILMKLLRDLTTERRRAALSAAINTLSQYQV